MGGGNGYANNLGSIGAQSGGANTSTTADQLRNQVLSQVATNLAAVTAALQAAFPQASSNLVTTATGGTHAVPANAAEFLPVVINGTTYKIALFLP